MSSDSEAEDGDGKGSEDASMPSSASKDLESNWLTAALNQL